jgi:hypothetical protein
MTAQVLLRRFMRAPVPTPRQTSWAQIHVFAGFAALALIVLQVLAGRPNYTRKYGLFLALVLAVVVALGGMVRSREPESTTEE